MFRITIILFILILSSTAALAAGSDNPAAQAADERTLKIHIITVGPGEDLFSRFGHIAIMVQDTEKRTKKVYNFGTFDFSDPNLQIKYAKGFLNYWLSIGSFTPMIRHFQHENRNMVMQTLSLTPKQAQEVARKLAINARPENREYEYRHYFDNCCTRIRDLLDEVTDGSISDYAKNRQSELTHRDWTRICLEGLPFFSPVILYSLGPAIDKPITRWDEEFLPQVFAEDLDNIKIGKDRRPLVSKKQALVKRSGPPPREFIPVTEYAVVIGLFIFLLAGFLPPLIWGNRKFARRLLGLGLIVWGLLAGLGGVMLTLYWTATSHFDTHYNENLLINPVLHLWLVGPGVLLLFKAKLKERTGRFVAYYLLFSIGLILLDLLLKLGPFIQNNYTVIAMAFILNTATLTALWRTQLVTRLLNKTTK